MPRAFEPAPDYEAAFAAAPGNFLLLDPDLTIVGVTDAYLTATSTVRERILGRRLFEVFPDNPDDPAADGVRNLQASLRRVLEHRRVDRMAVQKYDIPRLPSAGGGFEERYWSPINTPVLAADGTVRYVVHSVEDVTDFVRLKLEIERDRAPGFASADGRLEPETYLRQEAIEASRRLSESERRYRFLERGVPQLIWTADGDGRMDYCNERWTTFTGLPAERLRGDGWHEMVHPEDRDRVVGGWREAVAGGAPRFQAEHRLLSHDGSWRWVLTAALPDRDRRDVVRKWYGTMTDVHDRVVAEEQVRQTQRLQAMGKLAGGMAHEVNNMMTAVMGFGELVLAGLGPGHPNYADVEEMIRAGARASQVTRELLAFSRQQVLKPLVLDLNVVVAELTPVLQNLLGSDRRLETVLTTTAVRTVADRRQVEQVLINLVANARDATCTNSVVVVETGTVARPSTEFVRLTVRDNGVGMTADTMSKAFDPFFTTKPVGQGTGLGLSMVHGFARQSGGDVELESSPGNGTAVSVLLPRVVAEVAREELAPAAPRGTGESVLVVEDEPMVRSMVRRLLEHQGYTVYQAPNGKAALEFLTSNPGMVHLVLTDIVMPFMTGVELTERVRRLDPALPVILMSGYSGDEMLQRGLTLSGAPFLQKPVTPESLANAVRDRIDRSAASLQTLS